VATCDEGKFDIGEVEVKTFEGVKVCRGCFGRRGISKISTTFDNPLELFPSPKNILFVDDVDVRLERG
jgi:hypothetical protein